MLHHKLLLVLTHLLIIIGAMAKFTHVNSSSALVIQAERVQVACLCLLLLYVSPYYLEYQGQEARQS